MDKEQTLALWAQGRDAWNAWAKRQLDRRAEMEKAGEWAHSKDRFGTNNPENDVTRLWMEDSEAQFHGNQFECFANFSHYIFPYSSHFGKSLFKGVADFSSAIFSDSVSFGDTIFNENAWFLGSKFADSGNFYSSRFSKLAGFDRAEFHTVIFDRAVFLDLSSFNTATFAIDHNDNEVAKFVNTIFKGMRFSEIARSMGGFYSIEQNLQGSQPLLTRTLMQRLILRQQMSEAAFLLRVRGLVRLPTSFRRTLRKHLASMTFA